MMRPAAKNAQAGFTIIELMIATAIFTVILLIVTTGVISFSRSYYHGIINNNTQNITRSAVNEITQNIQFSAGDFSSLSPNGSTKGYCINNRPYYYILGRQLGGSGSTGTNHVLVTSEDGSCPPTPPVDMTSLNFATSSLNSPRELLGKHLRLTEFSVTPNADGLFTVVIKVAYGDDDLLCSPTGTGCAPITDFTDPNLRCRSEAGSQYCATAGLTTNVAKRL